MDSNVYGLHQTHIKWASGQAWEKKCSSSFVLHVFLFNIRVMDTFIIEHLLIYFSSFVFGFLNLCDYASARWRSTVSWRRVSNSKKAGWKWACPMSRMLEKKVWELKILWHSWNGFEVQKRNCESPLNALIIFKIVHNGQ